jgi:hypothetical protein
MDKNQKIVIALLVLAILFSAFSIFISYVAFSDIDLSQKVSGRVSEGRGSGGVSLVVHSSSAPAGGGDGRG